MPTPPSVRSFAPRPERVPPTADNEDEAPPTADGGDEPLSPSGPALPGDGDPVGRIGERIAQADRKIRAREDAVERTRAYGDFTRAADAELRRLQSDADLSRREVVQEYGAFLAEQEGRIVGAHGGSADSRARLGTRLTELRNGFRGQMAAASTAAQDALVRDALTSELAGLTDAASRDPSALPALFAHWDSRIEDVAPGLTPGRGAEVLTDGRSDLAVAAFTGLIDRAAVEDARTVMIGDPDAVARLSPAQRQAAMERVAAAEQALADLRPADEPGGETAPLGADGASPAVDADEPEGPPAADGDDREPPDPSGDKPVPAEPAQDDDEKDDGDEDAKSADCGRVEAQIKADENNLEAARQRLEPHRIRVHQVGDKNDALKKSRNEAIAIGTAKAIGGLLAGNPRAAAEEAILTAVQVERLNLDMAALREQLEESIDRQKAAQDDFDGVSRRLRGFYDERDALDCRGKGRAAAK